MQKTEHARRGGVVAYNRSASTKRPCSDVLQVSRGLLIMYGLRARGLSSASRAHSTSATAGILLLMITPDRHGQEYLGFLQSRYLPPVLMQGSFKCSSCPAKTKQRLRSVGGARRVTLGRHVLADLPDVGTRNIAAVFSDRALRHQTYS